MDISNKYSYETTFVEVLPDADLNRGKMLGLSLLGMTTKVAALALDAAMVVRRTAEAVYSIFTVLVTFGTHSGCRKRALASLKLLALKLLAVCYGPLQVATFAVAMLAGIIHPTAGKKVLELTLSLSAWNKSLISEVKHSYPLSSFAKGVNHLAFRLFETFTTCLPHMFKAALYTLTAELETIMDLLPLRILGKNPVTEHLNSNKTPVLLLHGNLCNATDFMPMIHALKEKPFTFYSIPLTNDNSITTDLESVKTKIDEILQPYPLGTKIHLVGHSRGGYIVAELSKDTELMKRIGKGISLGDNHIAFHDQIKRVEGVHDVCALSFHRDKVVQGGHFYMLQNPEVFKHIDTELQNS